MGDRGTHFSGIEWDEFLNVFDLEFVMIAAWQSSENGLIERAVSLVKIGYRAVETMCAGISPARISV